jgi:hypothetical protein
MGAPNCRGPLVFELTQPNERYATVFIGLFGHLQGTINKEQQGDSTMYI